MKLAVPYDQGTVHKHLGSTEAFKFYEIEDRVIRTSEVVDAPDGGRDALFAFLKESEVDVLLGGGMCSTAVSLLAEMGIEAFGGASGEVDGQVQAFFDGNIEFKVGGACTHKH